MGRIGGSENGRSLLTGVQCIGSCEFGTDVSHWCMAQRLSRITWSPATADDRRIRVGLGATKADRADLRLVFVEREFRNLGIAPMAYYQRIMAGAPRRSVRSLEPRRSLPACCSSNCACIACRRLRGTDRTRRRRSRALGFVKPAEAPGREMLIAESTHEVPVPRRDDPANNAVGKRSQKIHYGDLGA